MKIRMPDIAGKDKEATITKWHVREKGRVKKNADLVEVVTDKAAFDVPSPCGGVLARINKKEGRTAMPGEVIAEIREAKK